MKNRPLVFAASALVLLFFGAEAAQAFQWPVKDLAVTATFGENRWNHFHGGIDIGGGEQEIRPIDDGEVIFYFEEGSAYTPVPTGLGNFIVLEHSRGIRSLYAHLKPDTLPKEQYLVKKSSVIGTTGETGSSLGKHLHFEVSDPEFHQLVNPMRLLPELPDITAPTIGDVLLSRVGARANDILANAISYDSQATIVSGDWHVLLEVYDVSAYVDYFCPMAPYQVQLYLNGQKMLALVFDGLAESDDRLGLAQTSDVSFDQFYIDTWLFDAGPVSIPEGEVKIEIVASDYSGNETSKLISLSAVRK